jgi:protein-tyrosine phosphatase
MQVSPERLLPIAGVFNVRDLGGYAHAAGETRWRRILRADGLHRLTPQGIDALVAEGVTTIVDLRHDNELASHPNPFRDHDAVAYHHLSLFEDLAPVAMTGGDVLLDLYIEALERRGAAIVAVLEALAAAPPGVVLFHCTAGKDRTGLIAALVLGLAGVDADTIIEDYARTGIHIAPLLATILAEATERGMDPEALRPLLACEKLTMSRTLDHLERRWGSVEAYLADIGLTPATASRLRTRLLEDL